MTLVLLGAAVVIGVLYETAIPVIATVAYWGGFWVGRDSE